MDATKKISHRFFPDGDVGEPQVTCSTPGKADSKSKPERRWKDKLSGGILKILSTSCDRAIKHPNCDQ